MKKPKQRLNAQKIKEVVNILDGWSGKLTWDLLIDEIRPLFGEFSRQALQNHTRILDAFQHRKVELRCASPDSKAKTVAEQKSEERVARLDAEVSRLNMENSNLLEQFARWAYNASKKGISKEVLNQPLPWVDREQTKLD